MAFLFRLFRLFPMDRRKVVVVSFEGKRYGDNGAAVAAALHRLDPEVRIVWLQDRGADLPLPSYVRPAPYGEVFQMAFEMATAKAWVLTHTLPPYVRKRKGQIVVQVWHEGCDIERESTAADWERAGRGCSVLTDLAVSGSDRLTYQVYLDAFHYDGEILLTGSRGDESLPWEQRQKEVRRAALQTASWLLRKMCQ